MHSEALKNTLENCKVNDRKAQFELYKLYSKAMYNICLRMMKDEAEAEDVLQESFVKAFRNLGSYQYQATFGAWLKRIVINTCITELKRRKLELSDVEDYDIADTSAESSSEVELDIRGVKAAISSLPEGYRVIFNMYAVEGYDHQEIGEILNISASTSKSQYSRAKKKLREMLGGQRRASMIS